ncbi:MAG: phosphotransferase [Propylenella sp.]
MNRRELDRRIGAAWRHAAALPIWNEPVEPRSLPGGISNINFLVEDAGKKFVVRIGGDVEQHGVVRKNELAASRAAAAAGVAPAVIHSEPGVLVVRYIEGRTLTPADVRNPRNLDRIVALVRRTHQETPKHLRGPGVLFWVFHAIRDYEHRLLEGPNPNRALVKRLTAQSEELERAIGPIRLVFGHNDLLAANMIDDGERLWLVDWEYAGFNTALFDLGGVSSNSEMPIALRERMLEAYYQRPVDDRLRHRFAAMTAASLLRETMWSMVSEIHSQLDFNYAAYTAENLARFERAYTAFKSMGRA